MWKILGFDDWVEGWGVGRGVVFEGRADEGKFMRNERPGSSVIRVLGAFELGKLKCQNEHSELLDEPIRTSWTSDSKSRPDIY
jgi:hypothetical protein